MTKGNSPAFSRSAIYSGTRPMRRKRPTLLPASNTEAIKKKEPPWPERPAKNLMKREAALKNESSPKIPVPFPRDFLLERPDGGTAEDQASFLFPKEQWGCNRATD